eukprot:1332557-Amorphochlora_amoeboformis.AAC.1
MWERKYTGGRSTKLINCTVFGWKLLLWGGGGQMGFSFGTKYRSWIMLAATIITAISIILNVVAIVSISQVVFR